MSESIETMNNQCQNLELNKGCRGSIVDIDGKHNVWVSFNESSCTEPIKALLGKPFGLEDLQKVQKNNWQVFLEFEGNNPQRPIIQQIYYPVLDEILKKSQEEEKNKENIIHVKGTIIVLDADEIILNANKKIHIRSGKSRLFLNAFGDFVQRARQIVSRSSKTTKLKGGVVEIN